MMTHKLLLRGVHLALTDALREIVAEKTGRLFRRDPGIVRLRLDLEHDQRKNPAQAFIASGRIELQGPDLVASAASEDCYKSVDLLIDKLDGLLRRRHEKRVRSRNDRRRQAPDILHGKK
jgi:putative sigma-54 modulation protein